MLQAHQTSQDKPGRKKTALPIPDIEKDTQNAPESFSPDERFERRQARRDAPITEERRQELDAELTRTLGAIREMFASRLTPAEMNVLEGFAILQQGWFLCHSKHRARITNAIFGVILANCKEARRELETAMQEHQASEG
jgi:hypothetical protein